MAQPITATPSLRGKIAEQFISKLEKEKNIPLEPSAKKLNIPIIKELAFAISTNIKK